MLPVEPCRPGNQRDCDRNYDLIWVFSLDYHSWHNICVYVRVRWYYEMRIEKHPILEFTTGRKVIFTFDGKVMEGFEGETIAAALHAAGVRTMRESGQLHRPRGLFCNIGNCSSCLMVVNGEPNVRVCVERLQEGMIVETQKGKGELK